MTKFFASKKTGVTMALLASVIALLSLFSFFPSELRILLHSLTIGFALFLTGFLRTFSGDLNKYKPWGKELPHLTRIFTAAYLLFLVILFAIVVKDFPHLH
jgi:hypothetical protein